MVDPFVSRFEVPPYQEGRLSDLTFAVKDLIDVKGVISGCGNPDWEKEHPPAAAHAVCVEQLLLEGAHLVGKTITDELAFNLTGENHHFGTPDNPKAPERVPGGSSSGSASAVARGDVDFALGTDTGGSVRVPASNCGVYGFRPTHGRISLGGINPLAPSFDTLGFFANDVAIFKKVATVLLAEAPKEHPKPTLYRLKDAYQMADPEIAKALHIEAQEVELREIAPFTLEQLSRIYCVIQRSEIWSCLGLWVEKGNLKFGERITHNFKLAKHEHREELQKCLEAREVFARAVNAFLGDSGLLCMPTTHVLAPKRGTIDLDRSKGDYFPHLLGFTSLAGLGRLPQASLPFTEVDEVPIGLSLVGPMFQDQRVLSSLDSFVPPKVI